MNMNSEIQGNRQILEIIKYVTVIILLVIVIVGNYFYRNCSLFLRLFSIALITAIAVAVGITTEKGKLLITFFREARNEVRKVVWPSYQETMYTTLIVMVVTATVSLVLWGLDSVLIRIVSFITRLRF